jgi:signal peptidase II
MTVPFLSCGQGWFKSRQPWLVLVILVVVLDQVTKSLASSNLDYGQPLVLTGFFNLTLLHNTGAAFSFLSDAGGWQRWFFFLISAAVSVAVMVWMSRLAAPARLLGYALALVLGGALGNLWDRIAMGYVVDFIQVHYRQYYWPAFNIADSAICVGAALLLLDALLMEKIRLKRGMNNG